MECVRDTGYVGFGLCVLNCRATLKSCVEPQETEGVASPGEGHLPELPSALPSSTWQPLKSLLSPTCQWAVGMMAREVRNCLLPAGFMASSHFMELRMHRSLVEGPEKGFPLDHTNF